MITPQRLRDLAMQAPTRVGAPPWVSAASGLVRAGDSLYVVADDEMHLARFSASSNAPGQWLRLLAGKLPKKNKKVKRDKPDFEALTRLPATPGAPGGRLLALGSGSGPLRRSAALLPLDLQGAPAGAATRVDLSRSLAVLEARLPELNIEGAVVRAADLVLLHRGNRGGSPSAIVTVTWAGFLGGAIEPADCAVQAVDLGAVDGVPFSFTDAATLPGDQLLFSAVAEATDNRWDDGRCLGSAIGILGRDGRLQDLRPLAGALKVEGVEARSSADQIELMLVTDADDPDIPAGLYRATF